MDRVYQANAVETPPEPVTPSGSYPTAGSKTTGQVATIPGAYWFYSVTEELRNALIGVGLTPDPNKVNQLAEAFAKFLPLSGGDMMGNIRFNGNYAITTKSSENQFSIFQGNSASQGAGIWLYGNDNSGGGKARIQVYDKANSKYRAFDIRPDGTVGWDGNDVDVVEAKILERNGYIKYKNGLVFIWGVDQGTAQTRTINKLVSCTTLVAMPFDALYSDTGLKYISWRADLSTTTTETFKCVDGNTGGMGYLIIGKM